MKTRISAMVLLVALGLAGGTASAQQGQCYSCVRIGTCWGCYTGSDNGGTGCSVSCESCTLTGACRNGKGVGCFLGAVAIATPSGLRPIQELAVGDKVLSTNEEGETTVVEVIDTHLAESWEYLVINGAIQVTRTHPFYVDGGWVRAGDLRVGDVLTDGEGRAVVIETIARVEKGVRVYNISVDGSHTFFANGLYVHNKPPNVEG